MMNTLLLILNFFAPIIGIDVDQVLDMLPEQISGIMLQQLTLL